MLRSPKLLWTMNIIEYLHKYKCLFLLKKVGLGGRERLKLFDRVTCEMWIENHSYRPSMKYWKGNFQKQPNDSILGIERPLHLVKTKIILMISRFENKTKLYHPKLELSKNKIKFLEGKHKNTVYIINCRTEL